MGVGMWMLPCTCGRRASPALRRPAAIRWPGPGCQVFLLSGARVLSKRVFCSLLGAMLLLGNLAGCGSVPERELSRQAVPYVSLPNGHDPLNPERHMFHAAGKALAEAGVIPGLESLRGHALNILELS